MTQVALVMTMASAIGALHHCRADGIYVSPIMDDTYYRMRALMVPMLQSEGMAQQVANTAYTVYQGSFAKGVSLEFVPSKVADDEIQGGDEVPANDVTACKKVEAKIENWRRPGGPLNVAPSYPATKGLPTSGRI